MLYRSLYLIIILAGVVLLSGCSPQLYKEGRHYNQEGDYDRAEAVLTEAVEENPEDYRNWQELGVAYYKQGEYDRAENTLERSAELKSDPRTDLYLGLIYEEREFYGRAIDAYRRALAGKPNKTVRKMVNDRLDHLVMKRLNYEITQALESENQIDADTIPQNTVGVVDFDVTHMDPALAPLGKGLAEFTAIDLAKVKSLRVVDRLKIDMILNELQLSSSQYADPSTAPRLGKLLGSGKLVTGTMTGLSEERMRLDGAIVQTADSSAETTPPSEGELERIFQLQKEFVFNLLDKMGVELTAAERDSIRKSPTESYLALLAYSKGLDLRAQGLHQEAAEQFNNAYQIDNNFQQAARKAVQSEALASAFTPSGGFEAAVTEQIATMSSQLDSFQSYIISQGGFIPDQFNFGSFQGSTILPPRPAPEDNNVTIFIRGVFDAPRR